ncbi:hypothetical protein [Colwellia sp. C1TZA3]|uniref:hypothetical protein n=1 Tax=Colwellia sp. C1TZA3 TaxID=2508879 RepID=UPI0011B98E7A|nr:hypothetical protein [Colwellia sp. C1TZA3]TWX73246.1 hypothetical protein ESZ39_04750 [Colwellia sp. C1TZA3]
MSVSYQKFTDINFFIVLKVGCNLTHAANNIELSLHQRQVTLSAKRVSADGREPNVIPIPLSYCSLVLVKIAQGCVALTPNSQLLLNRAPYLELFFLRTTRSQT